MEEVLGFRRDVLQLRSRGFRLSRGAVEACPSGNYPRVAYPASPTPRRLPCEAYGTRNPLEGELAGSLRSALFDHVRRQCR